MIDGITNNRSASAIIKSFGEQGLTYRRQYMLDDIALAKGIELSQSPGAYTRAESWMNTVKTLLDEERFSNRAQAIEFMNKWRSESYDTIEEASLANELDDRQIYGGPGKLQDTL